MRKIYNALARAFNAITLGVLLGTAIREGDAKSWVLCAFLVVAIFFNVMEEIDGDKDKH